MMHAAVLQKIERRLPVGGLRYLISGAAEMDADQPPQPGIVFNDENVRHALPCLSGRKYTIIIKRGKNAVKLRRTAGKFTKH